MIGSEATDQSVISECVVQKAKVFVDAGENQKAIELLEKTIKEQPKNMEARELLGDIYFASDQYKLARRQYRYIFDHRRHAVEAALKLVQVYMCIPKKLIQAYKVLQRAVQYNPDHLTALLRFANFCRLLIRQAKDSEPPQDVEPLYAKAHTLAEGDLEASLELADHYLFTQQLDQARIVALAALALDDQDARVHHLLGLIYLQLGQFKLAELAYEKVLKLTGANVQIYHDLATLYLKQDQLPQAIEALKEATAYTNSTDEAAILWHQISILQIKNQQLAQALHACQQAHDAANDKLNLIYTLIAIHQQMMDYQTALAVLTDKLLPIVSPNDQRVLHLQATLYILDQQPHLAIPIYQQLVKIESQNADWFYYLGLAYHENQQAEQAKKALKRALRYNTHHAQAKELFKKLQNTEKKAAEAADSNATEDEPNLVESKSQKETPNNKSAYFDPLDLQEFLAELALEPVIEKLAQSPKGTRSAVFRATLLEK